MPDIMIDLIKVSKTYPPEVRALTDISLNIPRGELVFLTGKSGAGKTTLLRLISRMEQPSKGMIEVAGMDLAKLPQRHLYQLRRKIGMAYQDFRLLPERSVADNIAIAMEVLYRPTAFIVERTRDLLEQLDLSQKYHTPTAELSRGEQQRVAIARAVANSPEIILADEPTGNLDGANTERVMNIFRRLNRKGATLLIATHDPALFEQGSSRRIELSHGYLHGAPMDEKRLKERQMDLPLFGKTVEAGA